MKTALSKALFRAIDAGTEVTLYAQICISSCRTEDAMPMHDSTEVLGEQVSHHMHISSLLGNA